MARMPRHNKRAPWVVRPVGDAEAKRLYITKTWRVCREKYASVHPLCVGCDREEQVVDHIVPVRVRPELFWRADSHQVMCHQCHNAKRTHED